MWTYRLSLRYPCPSAVLNALFRPGTMPFARLTVTLFPCQQCCVAAFLGCRNLWHMFNVTKKCRTIKGNVIKP